MLKKHFFVVSIVCALLLLCSCGKSQVEETSATPAPVIEQQTIEDIVENVKSVDDEYAAIARDIVLQVNENILDENEKAYILNSCRGAMSNYDNTENNQFVALYSTDNNEIKATLCRVDKSGNLIIEELSLGYLMDSATANIYVGKHNNQICLFVEFSSFDGSSPYGQIYVYSLTNYSLYAINKTSYHGKQEFTKVENGLLFDTKCICQFDDNGIGEKLDGMFN